MTVEDTIERVATEICKRRGAHRVAPPCEACELIAVAAISSLLPGDKLPNGNVVVPREPTTEMKKAGGEWTYAADSYRAMIAALTKDNVVVATREPGAYTLGGTRIKTLEDLGED